MANLDKKVKNCFTVDVEDWFHVLDVNGLDNTRLWKGFDSLVEKGTQKLLDLLEKHKVTATFFIVGWIAQKYPDLVRRISAAGHEIASHTMLHRDFRKLSTEEAHEELEQSKKLLEDLTGKEVLGVRLPGAAVTPHNIQVLEWIAEAGYKYDSSVTPGISPYGGLPKAPAGPFTILGEGFELVEIPNTTFGFGHIKVKFSGGGYLRLLPTPVILGLGKLLNLRKIPMVIYVHPRDVEPDQPRGIVRFPRSLWHYHGLDRALHKLDRLLGHFNFVPCREFLEEGLPTVGLEDLR